ncbi:MULTISPECIES: hypothetical protein [unclassified Agarivorans]|uniref:hypothetical protein n=1 Tax=unclassified Agarivorans TaxID=2636026 RepID=UPI003D7EFD83
MGELELSGLLCNPIVEKIVIGAFIISFFGLIISSFFLHKGSEDVDKKTWLRDSLGGLEVFFTDRYLAPEAKKWRVPMIVCVFMIAACIYLFNKASPCAI